MSQTLYNEYLVWAIAQAELIPGMRYDADRARFVVYEKAWFPTYKQAKWYYDYIKKFGYVPSYDTGEDFLTLETDDFLLYEDGSSKINLEGEVNNG